MVTKRVRGEDGKFVKSEDTSEETPDEKDISSVSSIETEKQRLADEKTSEFLGEEVKDNKVVEKTEEKTEEKKDDKPNMDVVEEEIDLGKIKSEIKDELKKETDKEISDKLTAAGIKPTEEAKDKYETYAEKFAKEKGRNPSWFEFVPFLKDEVKAELKREQEEATKQTEEEKKKIVQTNEQRQKAFNTYLDEQLDDLQKAGKLDLKDPKVKTHFFKTMMEVNQKRVAEGKTPIYSAKEIFYEHYTPSNEQPAGEDAPISAGRGSTQVENKDEYSYQEIHKPSFFDLFKKK